MGYDNRPNLNCKQFDQNGTDYLYLAGHNCVCGTGGTISSNSGYQISGATILKTGVQLNTLLLGCNNVAGNASLAIGTSVNANGSTSIAIGSSSCSMGNKSIVIGNGSKSICDCATTIGYNNVSCAVNASIFGGNNNTICSGNTNTTLIGGTSITLASSTFANYVAIPNLAILCTPAGGGNYLCWNSTTKRVGVTTSTSVGWSSTGNTSTVVGCGTIISGSTYSGNTIYGVCAGKGITTGSNNTIIGTNAAYSNVTGSSNVILGSCSGYNETTSNKLYIANSANKSLIYGEFDNEKLCVRGKTYISGLTNSTKTDVIYYDSSTNELSYGTTPSGTTGSDIGWSDLTKQSTVIGCGTPGSSTALSGNTFYGVNAGANVTSFVDGLSIIHGCGIVAMGNNALCSNTCANDVIAIGQDVLSLATSIIDGTVAIGSKIMNNAISSQGNVAIGCNILTASGAIGSNNIGIGMSTLSNNTSGSNNISIGCNSQHSNTTGTNNISIGDQSLAFNSSGNHNIAFGSFALNNNIGCYNVAIGADTLSNMYTGNNNVGIGHNALASNELGHSNVAIGYNAGLNETGSNRLYIANSAAKSLIYGEFDNEKLCVRGKTYISGLTNASKSNIVFYDTSTKELSYGTAPITGEVNTASNLGSGYCIFTTKSGVNFPFKSLCAGTGIAMSCTANDITICNSAAQGEVNTASNLGSGYCIFTTKSGVNFPFKSLLAGTGIAMSCTANDITICSTGEANTASNLGSGYQIFTSKSGINLPFKSLLAGTAINITCTTTDITINSTAEANTASNLGSGTGVYASKSGVDLRFKSLLAGTGTIITNTANDITICGTGEANTASNLGTGYCIFTSKSGVNFPFKSLKAGTGIAMSCTTTDITFCSTITQAEINTASNLGSGVGIYASKSGVDLRFKSLSAGTNITITTGSTKITINSTGGGHTIKNNAGTALSPETYLTFKTNGIGTEIAADNAGATSTDISPRLNSLVDVDPTGIADGDVWSYDVAGSKTVPQPTVPYTDILRSVEANISTDKILSTYLPAGYQIDTIIIIETSGNAAGDITISSTSGGTDIVNAQTVGASADVKAVLVNTNGVYFSSVNDTDMYVSSSSWGSGVVSIYFTMEKII